MLEYVLKDPPPLVHSKVWRLLAGFPVAVWSNQPRRHVPKSKATSTNRNRRLFRERGIELPHPNKELF